LSFQNVVATGAELEPPEVLPDREWTMQNCPTEEKLRNFRARTLGAEEVLQISEHLAACPRCRARCDAVATGSADALPADAAGGADHASESATVRGSWSAENLGPTATASGRDPAGWSDGAAFQPLHIRGFRLLSQLHHGGQGIVYLAIQESTHRKVAIKVPLDKPAPSSASEKRFVREVELVAQLQHPNIVSIFDSGVTADGRRYFVMDYIRGLRLREYVQRNRLSLEAVLALFCDVCRAVHHAHQRGIVHRDLKPGNVLVTHDGVVKVLDFGLAKSLTPDALTAVSTSGEFVGTLAYTSPEQVRGQSRDVDQRSDVYSLGVMLYELLTGRLPVTASGELATTVEQICRGEPVRPGEAWSPEFGIVRERDAVAQRTLNPFDADLETVVLKPLAKDPSRRYATAEDLAADLERYLAGEPIAARRDSIGYVLMTRLRTRSQRHRWTAYAVCLLVAAAIANFIGVPMFSRQTGASAWWERTLTRWAPWSARSIDFDEIRIIALTDQTNIAALAAQENLPDVDDKTPRSLRRLHGRLMARLAAANCRVVAWDIVFPSESPFDEDFAAGAGQLARSGTPVVVGVKTWWLDADRDIALSPQIAAQVIPGCIAAGLGPGAPWRLQLCAQRGLLDPLPSLALAAFAALRQPAARVEYKFNAAEQAIALYYQPAGSGRRLLETDHIAISSLLTKDDLSGAYDPVQFGLKPTDTLALQIVEVAPTEAFEAITLEYADVLAAAEAQLRAWFQSRLVFVADLRSGVDRHAHPDGRELPGCYSHVAAVAAMLAAAPLRADTWQKHLVILAGAALAGVLLGRRLSTQRGQRWLAVGIAGLLMAAGSAAAFALRGYLVNPFPAMVALICAAEFAAALARLVHGRPE